MLLLLAQTACLTSPKGEIKSTRQVTNTDTLSYSNFDKGFGDTNQIRTKTNDSVTNQDVKKKPNIIVKTNDTTRKISTMPHEHPTVKGLKHIKDSLAKIKK